MKRFLQESGREQKNLTCSHQSVNHLSKNSMFHSHTKHIEVRYRKIKTKGITRFKIGSEMKELLLEKIHIGSSGSDVMTKALPQEKLTCR